MDLSSRPLTLRSGVFTYEPRFSFFHGRCGFFLGVANKGNIVVTVEHPEDGNFHWSNHVEATVKAKVAFMVSIRSEDESSSTKVPNEPSLSELNILTDELKKDNGSLKS